MQFWRNYRGYFFYSALLLILVGAAVGAWLICPPRVARLLPDGTTILYADAGTVRRLASLKGQAPGQLDGDYAQFVTQTGIDYERDLNAVALSIDGDAPGDGKVTGVVEGRYDRTRLIGWLSRHGAANSIYRGVDCYQMPVENRLLRVALLDKSTIAFSNLQNSAAFYATIDRKLRWTTLTVAPALVREHYRQLPIGSLFWSISRLNPGGSSSGPSFLEQFFPLQPDAPATLLFSLRSFTNVEARADFLFASPDDAREFADKAHTYLQIFRSIEKLMKTKGGDHDVQALFSSIAVDQKDERARLSASIPNTLLRKIVNGARQQYGAEPTSAAPAAPANSATPATEAIQPSSTTPAAAPSDKQPASEPTAPTSEAKH